MKYTRTALPQTQIPAQNLLKLLYSFSGATITNGQNLSGLRQQAFILSQLQRSTVQKQADSMATLSRKSPGKKAAWPRGASAGGWQSLAPSAYRHVAALQSLPPLLHGIFTCVFVPVILLF